MKRKGSILIISLFVFIIILMGALYIYHSSVLHMHIAKNNSISNQSFYSAEKKIYMSLYEDKYYSKQLLPVIYNHCRGNIAILDQVIIDDYDLDNEDPINKVNVSFLIKNNRKCMNLTSECKVNNQTIKVSSVYSMINHIYELGLPIIHEDYINLEEQNDLKNLILSIKNEISTDKLPRHMLGINNYDYEKILINSKYKDYLEFQYFRNNNMVKSEKFFNHEEVKGIEVLILVKDKFNRDVSLSIDSPDKKTGMNGILYLEGDLVINSEFHFNGIIIVNNGKIIVDTEIKPKINGIIISNGEEGWIDLEKINVVYDANLIYRYGTYLPDFLDYKFVVMKKAK